MLGYVLKTHSWPQPTLAQKLNEKYDDFHVIPSASLNLTAGGLHPWVIEMCHHMGVKVLWLPTWSGVNEYQNPGGWTYGCCTDLMPRLKAIPKSEYQVLLDENGELTDEVKECLVMIKDYDMVTGTGHITEEEALKVAAFCKEIGYKKLCWTHPLAALNQVTDDMLRTFVDLGGYIELTLINILPIFTSTTLQKFADVIKMCGPDRCYIATDHCYDWNPPIPVSFNMAIQGLNSIGIPIEDVAQVVRNPRELLGI